MLALILRPGRRSGPGARQIKTSQGLAEIRFGFRLGTFGPLWGSHACHLSGGASGAGDDRCALLAWLQIRKHDPQGDVRDERSEDVA
jgi:hypothetical protein